MKNFLNKILLVSLTSLVIVSCNSILEDVEPPTQISGEVVLSSPDAVNALRASMYSKIRANIDFTTNYFLGPSAFADELRLRPGESRMQALNVANSDDGGRTGLAGYGATYNLLLDANLIIGAVADGVLPAETLNRYRGEALVLRAFAMHTLVRAIGHDPTSPNIASWNAGIILRTNPTLTVADADLRPRSTVQETYTQIIADLTAAIPLLAGTTNRNYVNEAFAEAMLARVQLYNGNWAAADAAAARAITKSGRQLASTQAAVTEMFNETNSAGNHNEALFVLVVNPSTEQIAGSNINNGPNTYTRDQWGSQMPPQQMLDLYEANDYRRGWYVPCFNKTSGLVFSGCTAVNTQGLAINKFDGNKGNYSDDLPYFRLAELYLIRAEAAAKAANSPAAGVVYLNALKAARNASPTPAGALLSMDAFMDEVLAERSRELIAEGHRFWDLKRLGRAVPQPNGQIKFRADSHRLLSPIADAVIALNPDVVQNPGY